MAEEATEEVSEEGTPPWSVRFVLPTSSPSPSPLHFLNYFWHILNYFYSEKKISTYPP